MRQQRVQARGAAEAQCQLGPVRQLGVEERHPVAQRLGPQRHRHADTAQAQHAEALAAEAADRRVGDHGPAGRCAALPLVVVDQPPPERHGQGDGVVGHLRGAVVGHVAHQHAAPGASRPVDPVVTNAHPHHGAQLWETSQVGLREPATEQHQPVRRLGVGFGHLRGGGDVAHQHGHAGSEDAALLCVIRVHPLGVKHGRHAAMVRAAGGWRNPARRGRLGS